MRYYAIILLLLISNGARSQAQANSSAEFLHRAEQALTDVIVHDIFSPPAASRIYLYSNLAAYEALALQPQGEHTTLANRISGLPRFASLNVDLRNLDLDLTSIAAFFFTAKNFILSEQRLQDSADVILREYIRSAKKERFYKASMSLAKRVADSVMAFSSRDKYRETRAMRRFSVTASSGRWIPTPPGYMAAVEPNWGKLKPMMLDSASQFKPPVPASYTTDSSGEFYRFAKEVYETVKNLTDEQRSIALFWDCNPFFMNTSGHLMFATKKLSPGGHWISIAGLAAQQEKSDIHTSAAAYTFTSIALYDGFISCWDEKYRSNYIRPESFINSHIDEGWRPILQTPPFPEYTSGHSVISNAAAAVLTALFGPNFQFHDRTEVGYGLPVRQFSSFQHAADEAAVSRLYGGIHFREAIENGQVQGKKIGAHVVTRLNLRDLTNKSN